MKRFLLLLSVLFLIGLSFVSPASSQEFDYKKAYSDYLFKLDVYRKELKEFEAARDFYRQSSTLTLKEKVRVELYDFLIARDEVIATYVKAIRMRLLETPDHPGAEKGDILSELAPEPLWYEEQRNKYHKDSDSIETLLQKEGESEARYEDITKPLIYKTLSTISFSLYLDLKIRHENIYKEVKDKINTLEGSERVLFDRWIVDVDNEFQEITNVELEIQEIRETFDNLGRKKPEAVYKTLMTTFDDAEDSFRAINGFITEMVNSLNLNGNI